MLLCLLELASLYMTRMEGDGMKLNLNLGQSVQNNRVCILFSMLLHQAHLSSFKSSHARQFL